MCFFPPSSHNLHSSSHMDPRNHTFPPPGNNVRCSSCDCCHGVGGQRPDHQGDFGSGCTHSSSGFLQIKSGISFIKSSFRLLHHSVLPEPPVVTLTEVKDNTFSLVWTLGLEGDSPITGFILEYKAVNGKTFISALEPFHCEPFLFPHSLLGFHKDSCGVWP